MAIGKQILIIDDHPLYREGLKSIIPADSGYLIAGEAGTAAHGLQQARDLKPDLAIVDISLPDMNGIELTREILNASPGTRVLIVSMHSKIDYIVKAFQAGAMGYIAKESAADMLLEGMAQVVQGNYFMDTSVSHQVVKKLAGIPPKETVHPVSASAYDALTAREQEIAGLLAEGMDSRQIADRLFISPKTAENHRANIMRKLGLHNAIGLTRYAAKLGLIDVERWKD